MTKKNQASDQPLVSVLIPLYNHERYISETLNSVRDEGYPRLDVVIVDDVSPDTSIAVVEQWRKENPTAFERFQLIRHTKNKGITGTMNDLVRAARGEFVVCPLASDDNLLPGGIALRVAALQQRSDWLAVFGDAVSIDQNSEIINDSALSKSKKSNLAALESDGLRPIEIITHWGMPGPVLMARRSAYEADSVGLYNEDLIVEDRDFYLRLLSRNALGFVNATVSEYRYHPKNTMRVSETRKRVLRCRYESERLALEKPGFTLMQRNLLEAICALHLNGLTHSSVTGIARLKSRVVRQLLKRRIRSIYHSEARRNGMPSLTPRLSHGE